LVSDFTPLETKDLSVTFNPGSENEVVAFTDINFSLKPDEILATRVLEARGQVGYMLQKDMLLPWRNVRDNVALGLEVKGMATAERYEIADRLISSYGLKGFETSKPGTLSGGMRQRVAFMRTLALDPDVILLDEPFSALDFQTRTLLQSEVLDIIAKQRKSAILVTHDMTQ